MEQKHICYGVRLQKGNYACRFGVLDQSLLRSNIPSLHTVPRLEELKALNIEISDVDDSSLIELHTYRNRW